jgi:type I restriction enzyme S subunit
MMLEWQTIPIREVYAGMYDGPHATPKPSESGPVFLGIKNVGESGQLDLSDVRHISEEEYPRWIKRVEPRYGDIVFSYEATLNRYAMIPKGFRGCLGRRMALIRPDESKAYGRFLYYYFFGQEWRNVIAQNTLIGSTVDRIPIAKFPDFPITIPPFPTQRKIAGILSTYDDLIENNLRRIKILEEMAQNLYREWFVKFRFPGHQKVKMVNSPLGKIPEGWEAKRLGDIAEDMRRGVNPAQVSPDTPYIGLEHLPRKSIALSHWGFAGDVQSTKFEFKRGEILFGKIRPYFHKVGFAPIDGICSSDTIVIAAKDLKWYPLLLCCVSSEDFVAHATQTSKGTKMPRADWEVLTKYPVPVPPPSLLTNFNSFLENNLGLIENLILRNHNLCQTRDLLLPKLISGELDVSELDIKTTDERL